MHKPLLNNVRFITRFACVLILAVSTTTLRAQTTEFTPLKDLKTIAESSDFKETSRHSEVTAFMKACGKQNHVKLFSYGKTNEQRDLWCAEVANPAYDLATPDSRGVVLFLGNIHSGECAGKEALLQMLRELAMDANHPLLKNLVILIAPNYNADANDRMGKEHRPGQIGPEAGMGRRENAQQLDLNRDFIKLESPEARSLVALMTKYDPMMFVDMHTTNGSRHRYQLTYDIPHNPTTPQAIRDFMRNEMMPAITESLAEKGTDTFYYGNFNRAHNKWTTYGHQPRYSTEYFGLRGRLGVLSEAYSYISYKDRIVASYAFAKELCDYASTHRDKIKKLIESQDKLRLSGAKADIALQSKVEAFDEEFEVKGYDGTDPKDHKVKFVGNFVPAKTTPVPFAYYIPQSEVAVVDHLLKHGINVETLVTDARVFARSFRFNSAKMDTRPFQGHLRATEVAGEWSDDPGELKKGGFVVRCTQPLGFLASYMLEPESDDGLVYWNAFDEELMSKAKFPILRLPRKLILNLKPVTQIEGSLELTLDAIYGPNRVNFSGNTDRTIKWMPDSTSYTRDWNGRKMTVDAKTGSMTLFKEKATNEVAATDAIENINGIDEEKANAIWASRKLTNDDDSFTVFNHKNDLYLYDASTDTAKQLTETESQEELVTFSPDGKKIAFVRESNLFAIDLPSRKETQLTSKGNKTLLFGKLDWVYQEELYGRGNFKSFWWSPDSSKVAFLKLDESKVLNYTVTDHIPVRGRLEITNYPKAGDPIPTVEIGFVTVDDAKITMCDLSEYADSEFLISSVGWSGTKSDESKSTSELIFQLQDRPQTWLDLCAAEESGKVKKLFRDETKAWIESPGDATYLKDGSFLWLSPRNGFNHIYHYAADGKLIKQVTSGTWSVMSMLGLSADEKTIYLTGTNDSSMAHNAYSIQLDGSRFNRITKQDGHHSVTFNDTFEFFFDSVSRVNLPTRVSLRRTDGTFVRLISPNQVDQLKYYKLSDPIFMRVPTRDGDYMDAMMIQPPNFDASKKYPVLIYQYSGPQAPTVRDRWGGSTYLWHQMLAQKGYIIWSCDNRSATHRGAKFAWPIHRDMGKHELMDIEDGIRFLKTKRWVDSSKIAIWGWSYGGYMASYALTHSKSFAAGIAGAPVTDWGNYDAIYTERYMGLPQDNPEGYKSSSVVRAAADLHGELLLIHGSIDDNVHMSNSLQLAKALQDAGKQFDLMIYPKNRHGIRIPTQNRHLRKLMTEFILEKIPPNDESK